MKLVVLLGMMGCARSENTSPTSLRGSNSGIPAAAGSMTERYLDKWLVPSTPGDDVVGETGDVDFLYTWGAPGFSSPPLKSSRGNSCFPGRRVWTRHSPSGQDDGSDVDFGAIIASTTGWYHPEMETVEWNVANPYLTKGRACSEETTYLPKAGNPQAYLHSMDLYVEMAKAAREYHEVTLTILGGKQSYKDPEPVVRGWNWVNSAGHPGNFWWGGPQVSHLYQNPKTLECALTFQGSASVRDWWANLDVKSSHFCGLVDADEVCKSSDAVCPVRRSTSSFVHRGFRDHFRRIVQHDSWQWNILPNLPYCSKLYLTGHSLGGAVASLFAACSHKAPKKGSYGYEEDYKYIAFDQRTPLLLAAGSPLGPRPGTRPFD